MSRFKEGDRVIIKEGGIGAGTVAASWAATTEVDWDNGTSGRLLHEDLELVHDPIKVGDWVRRWGHDVIGKVEALDGVGFPRLATVRYSRDGVSYVPVDELVKVRPLPLTDLEAGDKATVKVNETDETFTATATLRNGNIALLGVWVGPLVAVERWTLLSIEKPPPPLPTEPGSVIYLPRPEQFAHRAKDPDRVPWIADDGARLTDRQVAEQGWEVA